MVRLVLLYSRKRADAREEGISDHPAVSCAVPFSPEGVLSENTNSFVDETPAFLYTILGKKEINMASCQSGSILQSFSAQAEGQRTNRLTDRQNEKSGQLSWINPVWDNRSPYGRRRSFHIKRTKQYQEGIFTLRIRENSFLVFLYSRKLCSLLYKNAPRGSHCGGEEYGCFAAPPQAENPAKQDSF